MPTNITSLYNGLFSDPETTLRRNFIFAGSGTHGAWKFTFFSKDDKYFDGFTTGRSGQKGVTKKRPSIQFLKDVAATGQNDLANGIFEAYYFPMIKDVHPAMAADTNTNCLEIPRNPGQNAPKIVWTGQLSACHVAVWRRAQNIRLCHIQPFQKENGAIWPAILNTQMKRHNHIDNVTIPALAPVGQDVSILVKPKIENNERAITDRCYFIGIYRNHWNFFCYHLIGGRSYTKLAALEDDTYEY